jgi:transcriptional regulator with XRE-family HTH domain/tetratricopeptide (TPR) repeat protein
VENIASFGYWVRRRRTILEMTQADLAQRVSCSLSMLRKIERDERRPSAQLAQLLADQLAIDAAQRVQFLRLARGQFVPEMPSPVQAAVIPSAIRQLLGDDLRPPFVGRERELATLHNHLAQAAGGGRMLFVAGEAGRGKTSLLTEFAHQALGARPDLLIAGGSSDVYTGAGDPLLPIRDLFRLLLGDFENVPMSGLLNHELATRLLDALPATVETVLDQGPHLVGTLVSPAALERRLMQIDRTSGQLAPLLRRVQRYRSQQRPTRASSFLQQERLFEEISATLGAISQRNPLLLILDDLHWVDASTAALLDHLARRLQHSPVLVIGSYRPEELAPTFVSTAATSEHALQGVLSESRQLFGQNRLDLDRLTEGDDLHFIDALLDKEPNLVGPEFRKQLARITTGNALFAVELLREMKERGDLAQNDRGQWVENEPLSWQHIPARVEGVIEKRIARLPTALHRVLDIACIQGESFLASVIASIEGIDVRHVVQQLSEDLDRRHRLIREQGMQQLHSRRLPTFRFRHHLFQKYLYEQLGAAQRMYLHEDVGNALEALYAEEDAQDDALPAAQLARHFQEARLDLKASSYLLIAGEKAARVLAFGEAAAYYERGLNLLEDHAETEASLRQSYALMLALARAYWHGGRVSQAVDAYEQAIAKARALDDPHAFAAAVLAYEDPRWRLNLDAVQAQQFIREALVAVGDEESGLRVRLLVNLARTLLASGARQELRATVDEALVLARRIDDQLALFDALRVFAQIDRRPETTADRLNAVEEMIRVAETIGDQERLADALDLYIYDHLELGNLEQVEKAMVRQRRVAEAIKQPFQLHVAKVFATMRAILEGRFAKAEQLAQEAAALSRQIGVAELDGILGIHMFTIRAEQGRLHEIAPLVKLIVAQNPVSTTWRPGLALIFALNDELDACREIFESLAADSFAGLPRDSMWVTSLAYLTDVCVVLDDRQRAAVLYELLLPYDGRTVVVGGATACYGAAARYLGQLATIMEQWQTAQHHFEHALEMDNRLRARPRLAHSQFAYAAMLVARGGDGDQQQATALLAQALATAEELGMRRLSNQIRALQTG